MICTLAVKLIPGNLVCSSVSQHVLHRSASKSGQGAAASPHSVASVHLLHSSRLPPGYQSVQLASLQAKAGSPPLRDSQASPASANHHLLESLSRGPNHEASKGMAQSTAIDALAVWSISLTRRPATNKPQQSQQQSSAVQASCTGMLQLLGYHELSAATTASCQAVRVLATAQSCAWLAVGDSQGQLQVCELDWAKEELKVSLVNRLPGHKMKGESASLSLAVVAVGTVRLSYRAIACCSGMQVVLLASSKPVLVDVPSSMLLALVTHQK